MTAQVSSLYKQPIPYLVENLGKCITQACQRSEQTTVFFRADDIGVPSANFSRMIRLFKRMNIPLNLAVVPSWLTAKRKEALFAIAGDSKLFCWHQHGYRHVNHQHSGKKAEFGEHRSAEAITLDVRRGKDRLEKLLPDDFYPFFTPPWNRCDGSTLKALKELGFQGISRSKDAKPQSPDSFPDIQINVDLHTRKEHNPEVSLNTLLRELDNSLSRGLAGIMLHHQRMNDQAFIFLRTLLEQLGDNKSITITDFHGIVADRSLML